MMDYADSTTSNIEELCKTQCAFQAIQQINETKAFDDSSDDAAIKTADQSEISSVSSRGMSKLQRRQSGSFRNRNRAEMGRFSSLPSGVGSVQSEARYSGAMSTRPYSPAPLIEFLPEIDFATPLFIGDSATQMLPIHANVPMGFIPQNFIKVNLNFRSGLVFTLVRLFTNPKILPKFEIFRKIKPMNC